jgi:hypothetical protein
LPLVKERTSDELSTMLKEVEYILQMTDINGVYKLDEENSVPFEYIRQLQLVLTHNA